MLENFNNTFSRLETYSAKGYTVTLYSDFALLSMEFSITDNGKHVLNFGAGLKRYHFPINNDTTELEQKKNSCAGCLTKHD